MPTRLPTNREAKNRPPRKPEPIEIAEASALSASRNAARRSPYSPFSPSRSAAWPDDITAGVISARPPTISPPIAGRHQPGTRERRNADSVRVTMCMMAMPTSALTTPSTRIAA